MVSADGACNSSFFGYFPAALVTQTTETESKRLLACSAGGLLDSGCLASRSVPQEIENDRPRKSAKAAALNAPQQTKSQIAKNRGRRSVRQLCEILN